ncbi:type II toxin-antitoxin system RelE/ParE family toxin [Arcanobacterium hippocoleae]|uniref:type II toxin-antitoxin system RelE/ParE family toxin n=1 Tax=Arcanobacterium hippocoleae TaxID=149017 RepID=UPI0033423906
MWDIAYSAEAQADLVDIYVYLAWDLGAPQVANHIEEAIRSRIRSLAEYPLRHRVLDDLAMGTVQVRVTKVGNYEIFYHADELTNSVVVVRILYAGRDIAEQLRG